MPLPRVTIVGLGPGPINTLTKATLDAIERIAVQFVRTELHPTATLLPNATSFDFLYERFETFDEVYAAISEQVVAAAIEHGEVLYAVPGSPLVLENSVSQLANDARITVDILPALSFLDLVWKEIGADPVNASVRLIDGHQFGRDAVGERRPLLVAQVHSKWVLSDVKLTLENSTGDEPVVILHHLGLPDQQVIHTTWSQMDQVVGADHLTSLYIPQLASPIDSDMAALHQLARTLRQECPWDREQTHESLVKYLLEETYEVVDALRALDSNDPSTDDALIDELGDLLYQIEFHAAIAEEQGRFSIVDIARSIQSKLVRRHPHVFGDAVANTAQDVVATWQSVKETEREAKSTEQSGPISIFEGVATSSPSLMFAAKLQKRAAEFGFDWPSFDGALAKVIEETSELRQAIDSGADNDAVQLELGDLLFSVVNLSRHIGQDAELALRNASLKFRARFKLVEQLAAQRGLNISTLSLDELDKLWDEAKQF